MIIEIIQASLLKAENKMEKEVDREEKREGGAKRDEEGREEER